MFPLYYFPTAHGAFSSTDGALFMYHPDREKYPFPIRLFATKQNLVAKNDYFVIDENTVAGKMYLENSEREKGVYQRFILSFFKGKELTDLQRAIYLEFALHSPQASDLVPFSNPLKDSKIMMKASWKQVRGETLSEEKCLRLSNAYMRSVMHNVFSYLPGISFVTIPPPRIFL